MGALDGALWCNPVALSSVVISLVGSAKTIYVVQAVVFPALEGRLPP